MTRRHAYKYWSSLGGYPEFAEFDSDFASSSMHLMYTLDDNGNRVYTLKVRLFIVCLESHPLIALYRK